MRLPRLVLWVPLFGLLASSASAAPILHFELTPHATTIFQNEGIEVMVRFWVDPLSPEPFDIPDLPSSGIGLISPAIDAPNLGFGPRQAFGIGNVSQVMQPGDERNQLFAILLPSGILIDPGDYVWRGVWEFQAFHGDANPDRFVMDTFELTVLPGLAAQPFVPVPEPTALAMLALSAVGVSVRLRRSYRRS